MIGRPAGAISPRVPAISATGRPPGIHNLRQCLRDAQAVSGNLCAAGAGHARGGRTLHSLCRLPIAAPVATPTSSCSAGRRFAWTAASPKRRPSTLRVFHAGARVLSRRANGGREGHRRSAALVSSRSGRPCWSPDAGACVRRRLAGVRSTAQNAARVPAQEGAPGAPAGSSSCAHVLTRPPHRKRQNARDTISRWFPAARWD